MYEDGKVCISILHPPGEDRFNEHVRLPSYIVYPHPAVSLSPQPSYHHRLIFFQFPQESAIERWRPILGVESIIVSVISMLSDPNDESPANIDAAVSCS